MVLGFPLCFDSRAQYRAWLRQERLAPVPPGQVHCWDCTPAYAAEMRAAGRCMRPGTEFIAFVDEDGDLTVHGATAESLAALRWLCALARGEAGWA